MDHNYFRIKSEQKQPNFVAKVGLKKECYKTYRRCEVPSCGNNTIISPTKLFLRVPITFAVRRQWLAAAGVINTASGYSRRPDYFFCEDHFELEKDLENYMAFKMGFTKRLRVKNGCLPSKFSCQKEEPSAFVNSVIKMDVVKGKNILAIETIWDNASKDLKPSPGLIVNVGKYVLNTSSLENDKECDSVQGFHKEYHKFINSKIKISNLQEKNECVSENKPLVNKEAISRDHDYCKEYL